MRITLVRHGESEGNIGVHDYSTLGDHKVVLTAKGHQQAENAGRRLVSILKGDRTLVYRSPYTRTRQTLEGLFRGADIMEEDRPRIYEDPRLRETEHGYTSVAEQEAMRVIHGWFYYRFKGGESPADCSDRISTFLESMMRQVQRKMANNVLIVTHGLSIRCFVMRYLHLSVEEFESLANPKNCDIITIDNRNLLQNPMFTSGQWGVEGIKLRETELPVLAQ